MACCAIGPCGNPACYLCTVVAHLTILSCTRDTAEGRRCRLVHAHPGICLADVREGKTERAELKESKPVPVLSGPREAATKLAFKKRHREGAFRQQRS